MASHVNKVEFSCQSYCVHHSMSTNVTQKKKKSAWLTHGSHASVTPSGYLS